MKTLRRAATAIASFAACVAVFAQIDSGDQARAVLEASGVRGGIVVVLACGDGQLTAALGQAGPFVVHGLDADPANVRKAQEYIHSLGIYGRVSVDRLRGPQLPYADNLVNLLIVSADCGVSRDEMLRVLTPRGVILPLHASSFAPQPSTVKPVPAGLDDWSHFLHDATGNPVAHDEVVGAPGRLQWSTGPTHTRSHEHTPSINALVSSEGRIFYVADHAPISDIRATPRWFVMARDAFNGTLLWQRPLDSAWYPKIINWGQAPPHLHRRLVTDGERVYATLGLHAPVTALDAATGETVRVYGETDGTEEMIVHNGTLLLLVRDVTEERKTELTRIAELARQENSPLFKRESAEPLIKQFKAADFRKGRPLLAVDADSGDVLWRKSATEAGGPRNLTLCAEGQRVFYQRNSEVVCLDLASGQQRWVKSAPVLRLVHEGRILCADAKTVTLLSAETGDQVWTDKASLVSIRDAFIANGSVWIGGFQAFQGRTSGKRGPAWGPYYATERDLATGKILRRVEPENPGHHHRCYQNKATDRYIFGGRRGTELIDLESGDVLWNSWARGVCRYGVMPCNGLLYAPPHACACYATAKLTGFNALAPATPVPDTIQPSDALERGPAYGPSGARQATVGTLGDWPTYRGDATRSGCATIPVPTALRRVWQVEVGTTVTAPTIAGGKVFVACADEHLVHALNADTGQAAWSFTAAGRIDSPPTLHRDRAVFGCRDGSVYSLRVADGALAWRARAARSDRLVAARGQFESAWPVHGSVLPDGDTLCLAAGRSSYLDGGIDLCRIDADTGESVSRHTVYSPDPETGCQPEHTSPSTVPGARTDILVGDDTRVYLRDTAFDKQLAPSDDTKPHLFTLTDFLDASWPHRSYWMFGTRASVSMGCGRREKGLIFGRLLVFNDSTIYGYGRKDVHWSNHLEDGAYRLFAVNRNDNAVQWTKTVPIQVRAMVFAGDVLFAAGPLVAAVTGPDMPETPQPATLMAISVTDGSVVARHQLDVSPVFDGMAAAGGCLYVSLSNGLLLCLAGKADGTE